EDVTTVSSVKAKKWEALFENKMRSHLETNIFPAYLKSSRWFGGKSRVIQNISISNQIKIPLKDLPATLITLEINYNDGLPEVYQLPLAFTEEHRDETGREIPRKGIIANMQLNGEDGILFDAVYHEDFRNYLFESIRK